MFRNIERRVVELGHRSPILGIALDRVRPFLEKLTVPSTIVHGDFAPWNVQIQGSELGAFDWEYGELDGLPLMDELHHALQVGFLLSGWAPQRALAYLRSVQSANRLGLQPKDVVALQVVYLLDVSSRRLEDGYPPDETLNRYLWLVSALTSVAAAEGLSS